MSPTKKRRVADYSQYKLPFSPASSAGKDKVQVVIPSPSNNSEQLPTPAASSQVRDERAGQLSVAPACGANLTYYIDNSDDDTLQIGHSKAHANGANGGMPIFGGAIKALEEAATIESTSEEDITPIRSGRRARAAPITLTDEEDSDHQVAPVPVTSRRCSRTYWPLPNLASSPSSEIGDSSEDDIITPVRRRRSTANIEPIPQRELPEGEEVQELDDDVADLSDTGESMLAKCWANSRKL